MVACTEREELVCCSKYFAIYQCDLKRCFCLQTEHQLIHLSLCQLLAFRKKVINIDLYAHFYAEENPSGMEILFFCNQERVLVLDTYQVIDLKKLIKKTFKNLSLPAFAELAA